MPLASSEAATSQDILQSKQIDVSRKVPCSRLGFVVGLILLLVVVGDGAPTSTLSSAPLSMTLCFQAYVPVWTERVGV